jgi:hypothetical protein
MRTVAESLVKALIGAGVRESMGSSAIRSNRITDAIRRE